MRSVYLPVEHSESDLVLAGQLADMLESTALYVTWGPQGYEQPQVETVVRVVDPAPAPPEHPEHSLLVEVVGIMAAFVAAIFAPRPASRPQGGGAAA